ncbi:MAG: DUF4079 domain-containing protein [Oscillatoriales cyanobacterium]|nr:MAG: DUF4079 domain-containing protein [Oscillatoriales cyanobacterium]
MGLLLTVADRLTETLEPIAAQFRGMNLPEPITHWGHPLMMGIVMFAMGTAAVSLGWKGRLAEPSDEKATLLTNHKRLALWMTTFMAMGYSGGLLSLVMQQKPILESPHFWTGTLVLGLLGANGAISMSKFGGGKPELRTAHAYLGTAAFGVMVLHAVFGLRLGLSF